VLLNKQGGFCPAMNPFVRPENKDCRLTITPDCCAKTLDILARTGSLNIGITMTRAQCEDSAKALCQAGREIIG
jgi:hypothetical protein